MKLTAERILRGVAEVMKVQITPALEDGFAQEASRMSQALLTVCANELDAMVEVRVQENTKLRALFADAAGIVRDDALRARLQEASASRDPGLRISVLDAETARLRTLLVALHADVEMQDHAEAKALNQRIWAVLREVEMSRAPVG